MRAVQTVRTPRIPGQALGVLALAAATAAAGAVLVHFPPEQYSFYPACPIRRWTGLLCPGCGGTRALAALLHGRFADAMRLNALVVGLLAGGFLYLLLMLRRMHRGEPGWLLLPDRVWMVTGVIVIGFTLARNFA